MLLARVVGSVVCTRKEKELEGLKLLMLQMTTTEGKPQGGFVVAVDAVGAGNGDLVLYVAGSSARQTEITQNRPVDATIMAIVDLVEDQGRVSYNKAEDAT